MGNIQQESNFSPTNAHDSHYPGRDNSSTYRFSANDGIGFGLIQWTFSSRKGALQAYAARQGGSVWDNIGETVSVEQATSVVFYQYIRYSGGNLTARIAGARQIYQKFYNPVEFTNW